MQSCTICYAQSPDEETNCINCGADLREFSATSVALKRFQKNPRVRHVIFSVMNDSCPACQKLQGAYPKDLVPRIPVEGCSFNDGCRCFYQPVLDDIYP